MAYDNNTNVKNLIKAQIVRTVEAMPFACWCITGDRGLGKVLFFRKIDDNKLAKFFEVDGEERMWDAEECFRTVGAVRLLYPTKIELKGDDRPIFNTESELQEATAPKVELDAEYSRALELQDEEDTEEWLANR